jgi:hypothetical protein
VRHRSRDMKSRLQSHVLFGRELNLHPRLEPIERVRPKSHKLISGRVCPRTKLPHALLRGRRAPRGMGPILARGVFQPSPATVTHPPWIEVLLLRVYGAVSLHSVRP